MTDATVERLLADLLGGVTLPVSRWLNLWKYIWWLLPRWDRLKFQMQHQQPAPAGEMTLHGEMPFSPYYGSVDATPLFLVLLSETFSWTGDEELVRELLPAAYRALDTAGQSGLLRRICRCQSPSTAAIRR